MSARSASGVGFREVCRVAVACQYHVACVVGDDGVKVSGGIIEEFFYLLHCLFGGVCLLGGDGAKCRDCEHFGISCSCVVKESTCYFLDKLFVGWDEW